MTTNPLGPGVSRYTDNRDKQLAAVVFEYNRPPLDSELNLISLMELEARAESLRALMPSGWLMNESNPRADFFTSPAYSNLIYFGRNTPGEVRNLSWAVVNGWMIPVAGTRTGAPPLAADDQDTWNKILLNPPSTSTGGNRAEFAFLEVWLARIDTDPAPPTVAPGKPQRGFLYRFGNVEGGFSYIPDDLVDPDLNYETTKRVQIQYRIRVSADVNLAQYPEGFDPTLVFAQGMLTAPSLLPFQNMRQALGDPGLWRAGTGDPATFGTADGYVYAIPLCAVFRRNSAGFSDVGNLAGAFNRNSKANLRTDALVYRNQVVLTVAMGQTDTSFSLPSIDGTILATMNSFGEAYFRLDDEVVRVNNVVAVSPTLFTMTVDRGQLQTTVRPHKLGTVCVPYTVRPDGLFADQVSLSDVLDLRHSVADKFDYDSILRTNLMELMKGNLRTTWKRFGSTNSAGPVVFYGDRITDSSVFVGGLTRLDAPDGNRRMYSDAATVQRFNVPCTVPSNSAALGDPVQFTVSPYVIAANWTGNPPIHSAGNRLSGGTYPSWWNGDKITIGIASFRAGLPGSDAGQVRFVLPSEDLDAVVVRFEGMTTDPNGGNPPLTAPTNTSPSATNPTLGTAPIGQRILKNGQGISVTLDGSGNLVITLQSGAIDIEFQEFRDAIQGITTTAYVQKVVMHVEFAVLYGTGRGLSHKPDFVHTVQYRGSPTNASKAMLRGGLSDKNRMIPTYLGESPYVQTGNNRNLARTSEVMVDPGSKSAYVAPYRNVLPPAALVRSGTKLNWWYNPAIQYQGAMPLLSQDGSTTVHTVVDPLDLFYSGTETRYAELPMDYLPRPGLHHIPILPSSGSVFSSGINFFMMAKEGTVLDTSDYNRSLVSYPSAFPGNYIATPLVSETYGLASGSWSIFGQKYSNSSLRAAAGGAFRGIKFPPFLAPARITGVYRRNGVAVVPTSSPFNTDRVFVGGAGTDVNLLRDSFDGPTVLLDVDSNGDAYFVLNADVLDLTRVSATATFDNTEFLVECVLFGFDRGFLQTNGRVLVAKNSGGGTIPVAADAFVTTSDNSVGVIAPAPLSSNASNNEVTFYYSRTPYQGDSFGTQSAYSDDLYRLGPMTVGEANSVRTNPLGPVSTLTLPNKTGLEVLAATSFVTSLGTGRLSGSPPLPLLNTTEAPNNPPDYAGTIVDLNRRFSLNRVGFDDWATTKFPVAAGAFVARPATKLGALSENYDNEAVPEFAGCTAQLPLGIYFRDKDFVGKTLYHQKNSSGIGAVPIGTLASVNYEAALAPAVPGTSTWEGTEFVCGSSSGTAGVGTEAVIRVDGTSNPASTTIFKTSRGGAAWSATGPWPGGVISSRFPKARPNADVGSVLVGMAYLVRSQPESVGLSEYHMGNELQMLIVTQAVPAFFRDTDVVHSASGANEGFTAADRFRILGKPLEKRRGAVDTSVLPSDKPVFVNNIFDNPLFFGSSDVSLNSTKQEIITVPADGTTVFTLTLRPLDPTTVQVYLNGVKLAYGLNYTVGGTTNQTLTYIPSILVPTLFTTDVLEAWYNLF
jgi:hypothetical protein